MDTCLMVVVVLTFPMCHGLVFTSTPNATSETCDGADFTFNWIYTSGTPNTIAWTKRNNDFTLNATLATVTTGTFAPDPAYATRVTREGTNGVIKLSGTTAADNGVYQIEAADFSTTLIGNTTLLSFATDSVIEGSCKEAPFHDYTVTCRMQVVTPVSLQLLEDGKLIASASSETGIERTGLSAFGKELKCSATGDGQQCMKNNNRVLEVPVPQLIIVCLVLDIICIAALGIIILVLLKSKGTWQGYAAIASAAILTAWTFIFIIVIPVKYSAGRSEPIFIAVIFFTVIGLILGIMALVFLLVKKRNWQP